MKFCGFLLDKSNQLWILSQTNMSRHVSCSISTLCTFMLLVFSRRSCTLYKLRCKEASCPLLLCHPVKINEFYHKTSHPCNEAVAEISRASGLGSGGGGRGMEFIAVQGQWGVMKFRSFSCAQLKCMQQPVHISMAGHRGQRYRAE